MAVDLSRQKELDADPKAIQQIEFVGFKECVCLKFSQGSITVLKKMADYEEPRVK